MVQVGPITADTELVGVKEVQVKSWSLCSDRRSGSASCATCKYKQLLLLLFRLAMRSEQHLVSLG